LVACIEVGPGARNVVKGELGTNRPIGGVVVTLEDTFTASEILNQEPSKSLEFKLWL
jgi:hypothetical protein